MSNKTEFIANIISEFIYNLKWENLSKEIHEKINTHILDTFGVMLRGSTYPVSNMIFNGVLGSTSEDSSGEATIVGKKTTGPILIAALLNGTSAHGLEFDDGSKSGGGFSTKNGIRTVAVGENIESYTTAQELFHAFQYEGELI